MNALAFAWRSLIRQPARSTLGILGVAAVGALLFDMLLLSEGLVLSMRDLLDRFGFEIRVISTDTMPRAGPDLADGAQAARQIAALRSVRTVVTIRTESARLEHQGAPSTVVPLLAAGGPVHPWSVMRGRDIASARDMVINEYTAQTLKAGLGSTVTSRAYCSQDDAAPPVMAFRIVGMAEFPLDGADSLGAGLDAADLAEACAQSAEAADFLVVTSAGDPDAAAAEIAALRPDLMVLTNEQVLGQLQQRGFTYFRQISSVLTTVTVSFALLLITVLLTVSVNQRLGEVAALRALGFSQRRVVLDVLCESALIIGLGGLLSLPLGALLAVWLDGILREMPGVPAALHFFVFRPDALVLHAGLLAATAVLAAVYPMRIVSRLPIAATLRNEVVS